MSMSMYIPRWTVGDQQQHRAAQLWTGFVVRWGRHEHSLHEQHDHRQVTPKLCFFCSVLLSRTRLRIDSEDQTLCPPKHLTANRMACNGMQRGRWNLPRNFICCAHRWQCVERELLAVRPLERRRPGSMGWLLRANHPVHLAECDRAGERDHS